MNVYLLKNMGCLIGLSGLVVSMIIQNLLSILPKKKKKKTFCLFLPDMQKNIYDWLSIQFSKNKISMFVLIE